MRVITEARQRAARENGKKGGAPKTDLTRQVEALVLRLGCSRQWAYRLVKEGKHEVKMADLPAGPDRAAGK